MATEFFLTAITLIVAIIGTLLRDPPNYVKAILIGLAVLASVGSVIKSINDESDKVFIQTALISTLTPSNVEYERLCDEVNEVAKPLDFDADTDCYHGPDSGMTALLSNKSGTRQAMAVFNRAELANMYANQIRHVSNRKLIDGILHKSYAADGYDDEFMDKAAILGVLALSREFARNASNYFYDDKVGVRIEFASDGKTQTIDLPPAELRPGQEKALDLFYRLHKIFVEKFKSAGVQRS